MARTGAWAGVVNLLLLRRATCAAFAFTLACAPSSAPQSPTPLSAQRVPADSVRLGEVTGWYRFAELGPALVTWGAQQDLTLLIVRDTMLWAPMVAAAADSFSVPQPSDRPPSAVRILRDGKHRVTGLRWTGHRGVRDAERDSLGDYSAHSVEYMADDGEQIAATLFLPHGRGPHPGAVMIHGSGTSTRDNSWYMALVDAMASRGIAVLFPDKRGSGRSGGDWRTADLAVLGRDVLAGVRWLRRHPALDTSAIGLVGVSQGGHIAPWVANESPRIAYVVNLSGSAVPLNDQLRHEVTQDLRRSSWPGFMHPLVRSVSLRVIRRRQPEWWARNGHLDPIADWSAMQVPGLILYGADDESDNVPVRRSVERLTALGKPNLTTRVFEGSGHALYAVGSLRIREEVRTLLPEWIHEALARAPAPRGPHRETMRNR